MIRLILCSYIVATGAALAHTAASGWRYSQDCCSTKDCAEIANATVRITPGGYEVTLSPGDHAMVVATKTYLVAFDDERIRRSGDEFFHACIGVTAPQFMYEQQRMICLYVPDMGF